MNSSHGHPNQIVMEPITRVERGGRGTNLSEPARPNRSHRRLLIPITGILIAGARKQFKQHREVGKATGAGKPLATGSAPAVKINKLSSQSSSFASSSKTGKTKAVGRSADGNYLRVYVPDPVSSKPSPRNRTAKAKPSNADFNTDTSSLGEIDRWQGHGKPAGGKKKGEKVSRTPILDS